MKASLKETTRETTRETTTDSLDSALALSHPYGRPSEWASSEAGIIMDRCDQLAGFSQMKHGIERTYLSPEMKSAYQLTGSWMKEAGLTVHIDPAGNLVGKVEGRENGLPALVLGSHLDSVPDAGRYDGILGVVSAIAVAKRLTTSGLMNRLPFSLEVVGFGDEEGARFGATLLGSYALAGSWNREWLNLKDADGISMREAFLDFGLDPDDVGKAALSPADAFGYMELHIEQGPILESRDRSLSFVSSIAAASRYVITVTGESRHIATPYNLRRDALTAAAEMIESIDRISREAGARSNVGEISAFPGGVNVIAGTTTFSLDVRAGTDDIRDSTLAAMWNAIDTICTSRKVSVERKLIHTASAVTCDTQLRSCIAEGIEKAEGKDAFGLVSFPGHDGMAVSDLLPIAMLYVRCKGGISHSPDESVRDIDVALGIDAFEQAVETLAARFDQA
ncbi:allantoate amidohydrolase [Bifidobacterium aquikefiri]|uniref:Zn-dependent hydrolase n=1 Tax=Bifidobacterium aquikefiri TaxID=1653207 RepID=A0A261GAG8_9BIFI|nr:allantoate amidohydrolase [Bifidobacterium aquikefiri]OZG68422.1 Zn-dependent hydrolase [Bifidobacterium aquikefiri]